LISLVENRSPQLPALARALAADTGRAHVIGLTGAPGVGKSTTTAALVGALREQGRRVGVLAVDPSSPFSGGALLGDRVRMQAHALDPGVYIRSMATRGHLGGLAVAAPQALRVLDAAGFDVVLLETVGVGQSEIEVAALADTTLVLLAPGMGDGVQAAKAGILEIGDLFVVNKSDREGAQALIRELRGMVALGDREPGDWKPPIVSTVASRGEGIPDLLDRIEQFRAAQEANGQWTARRVARARQEVEGLVLARLQAELALDPTAGLDTVAEAVSRGEVDAYTAADRVGRAARGPQQCVRSTAKALRRGPGAPPDPAWRAARHYRVR
jgi:LAO/AO transport system kinase